MRFFYILTYIILWIPCHVLYPMIVTGRANIPAGACVICANHSNYIDPLLLIYAFGLPCFLHCMSKQENMDKPVIGWIYKMCGAFGVNRGEQDIAAARTTLKLLKDGKKVVMFPEGTRTPVNNAEAGKTGAVRFASKCGVPIVPVFITRGKTVFHLVRIRIGECFEPHCHTQEEYLTETRSLMETIFALGAPHGN